MSLFRLPCDLPEPLVRWRRTAWQRARSRRHVEYFSWKGLVVGAASNLMLQSVMRISYRPAHGEEARKPSGNEDHWLGKHSWWVLRNIVSSALEQRQSRRYKLWKSTVVDNDGDTWLLTVASWWMEWRNTQGHWPLLSVGLMELSCSLFAWYSVFFMLSWFILFVHVS